MKVEELLFETSDKIVLQLYNMPNSLLYIDNTLVQEYTNKNEILTKYLEDKKEKYLELKETTSEENKTDEQEGSDEDGNLNVENLMVIQKKQTEYPKINNFEEDKLFDELDTPKIRATSEINEKHGDDLIQDSGDMEKIRARGLTTILNYSKLDLMNMAKYYLPIEKRIFKTLTTSLDLAVSNTMVTALRNFMNDGRSKQTTLTKAGSFSYEDLSHLQEEIEGTSKNRKLI